MVLMKRLRTFKSFQIWIRIGSQPKLLDPDPDEMNAHLQPWFGQLGACVHSI